MSNCTHDVVIVGGGLVGATLACALSQRGVTTRMIEAVSPRADAQPSYDDRTLAIALGSIRRLEAYGIWPGLERGVTPIRRIHVSDRGHFGFVRLNAEEFGHDHFGCVAEARIVGQATYRQLEQCPVDVDCPARVRSLKASADHVELELDTGATARARLVVGCDGTGSWVRQTSGLEPEVIDYQQVAVIANVTPEKPHQNQAFERLTETGPLALLPHVDQRCGLVWTVRRGAESALLEQSDEDFLSALQERFGYRMGRFRKVGRRTAYPLSAVFAHRQIAPRTVLIGNAAHTIHPISAQGFNLGLRDVSALTDIVAAAKTDGVDPGEPAVLERYSAARRADQLETLNYTDGLVRWFASESPPVIAARNLSMCALDLLPGLKRQLVARRMGF